MSTIHRALFVDDEVHIIDVYRSIAASLPVEPLFAFSAEEAWQLIQDKDITVVISDYRMPGANGAELLAWIRQKYPGAIRVICSGYTDADVLVGSINSGHVFRFIQKPFNTSEIIDTVNDALLFYIQHHAQEMEIQNLIERTKQLHLIEYDKSTFTESFSEDSQEFSLYECLPVALLVFDKTLQLRFANQLAKSSCFIGNCDDYYDNETILIPILVSIVSQSSKDSFTSEIVEINQRKLLISVNSTNNCESLSVTVSQLPD